MPAKKPRCCACSAVVDAAVSLQCNSGHWCCRDCTRNFITIRLGRCEDDFTNVPCCLNTCAERYDEDEVIPFLTKEHLHSIRCIERQKAKESDGDHEEAMDAAMREAQALAALTFITCCFAMESPSLGALCWCVTYGSKLILGRAPGIQASIPDAKGYFWGTKEYDGTPVSEYWLGAAKVLVCVLWALAMLVEHYLRSASVVELFDYRYCTRLWDAGYLKTAVFYAGLGLSVTVGSAELLYRYPWLRLVWSIFIKALGGTPILAVVDPLMMHCLRRAWFSAFE